MVWALRPVAFSNSKLIVMISGIKNWVKAATTLHHPSVFPDYDVGGQDLLHFDSVNIIMLEFYARIFLPYPSNTNLTRPLASVCG